MTDSPRWAPDFVASTTQGPIAFHEWAGLSWVILFGALEEDATWAAELAQVSRLQREAEDADARIVGLLSAKAAATAGVARSAGEGLRESVNVPVISDPDRRILGRFGYSRWRRRGAGRPVFVVDPCKRVQLTVTYPRVEVRDFREILGLVEDLRLAQQGAVGRAAAAFGTQESMAGRFWPKTAYHLAAGAGTVSGPVHTQGAGPRRVAHRGRIAAHDGKPLAI
jgi:alkyl hydroperoxide reductase subunit AhpC